MLGARTKQVNSYGKRSQRIVTSSNERRPWKEIPNIFDESEAPVQWAPIVSKMRKRENVDTSRNVLATPRLPPSRVIHVQRRRPLVSPIRKKKTTRGVLETTQPDQTARNRDAKRESHSSRPPLAVHSSNIPSSPATTHSLKRATPIASKKLYQPVSNVIDVDIIVLDEDGNTVAKERRVSLASCKPGTTKRNAPPKVSKLSDDNMLSSGDELIARPKRKGLKRHATTMRVDSDNSGSEDAFVTPPPNETAEDLDPDSVPSVIPSPEAPSCVAQLSRSHLVSHLPDTNSPHVIPPSHAIPVHSEPNTSRAPLNQLIKPSSSSRIGGRYTHVSSPIVRPRQLTPIRAIRTSKGNIISPTPSTSTDSDTSIDYSNLELDSIDFLDPPPYLCDPSIPENLKPLLEECHQEKCGLYEFSAFIKSFPHDPIVQSVLIDGDTRRSFKKIGEASYSEVFGIGDVVLKIIPLRNESTKIGNHDVDGPATTEAKDVRKEIIVTRAMGEVCDGFVNLLRTYVVRGRYPDLLLQLWDEYNETRGSESVRPDSFTVSQVYAIIVLPNGGPDLETYTFTNPGKTGWKQACSVFWQVTKALAHAEQLASFEHRDLHWGQILVKDLPFTHFRNLSLTETTSERLLMDDPAHGVQATIIDLGLSRMDASDSNGCEKVYWTPIDEEVFMGEGDYQFDVYRLMKQHVADWAGFNPMTNVMWLHYLVLKLLQSKRLRPPVASGIQSMAITFTEKECYKSLLDVESLLAKSVLDIRRCKVPPKGKVRRKPQGHTSLQQNRLACASDVVRYGVQKGWIVPSV